MVGHLNNHGRPLRLDLDGKGEELAAGFFSPSEVNQVAGGGGAVRQAKLDRGRARS